MPLNSGKSQSTISENIQKLISEGYEPKQAAAIAYSHARRTAKDAETHREYDINGWAEISDNPISKVGVFPYSGAQIGPEMEQDKIYMIYRPEEELSAPDCVDSFRLVPWTDEHAMLGDQNDGLTPAELKGVHGVVGENVYYEDGYLRGNLKVFSEKLHDSIENGKKELSIGYRCLYDMTSGEYNGIRYDGVQRKIRGNHLALVTEGRAGPDVAVLDHFKCTYDSGAFIMPDKDEQKKDEGKDEGEMGLPEVIAMIKELAAKVAKLDESRGEKKAEGEDADPAEFVNQANITENTPDKIEAKAGDKDEDKDKAAGMDAKIKQLTAQVSELKKTMDAKTVLKEISQRNALAVELSKYVGTFDHSEKTLAEVAAYGVKKLGLTCQAGHEQATLNGYFAAAKVGGVVHTQDGKRTTESGCVDAYLNGGK